ncbi:MFS transporter [Terrilactibacillus sp. S3-3]|nr:MFS transporter [Terrilactibacillus sp. S3-3]
MPDSQLWFWDIGGCVKLLVFLFDTVFLLPFYFDRVLHFSTSAAGTYLSITPLIMTVCAPIAGALSDRIGPSILTTMGMFFSTLGLILFGIMGKLSSVAQAHWILIIGLVLAGLGTGIFAAPQ